MSAPADKSWEARIAACLEGSVATIDSLRAGVPAIAAMCNKLADVVTAGGTIYTAGNGGSAAQALHLAEELIGRYRSERPPIRAVCLNADPTALTCIANDFGFAEVFARQVEALVTRADALVVFSTSGNSENVVRGLDVARRTGAVTVGLLGRDGGACAQRCSHAIVVPGADSAHIQEAHQVLLHLICERLEAAANIA